MAFHYLSDALYPPDGQGSAMYATHPAGGVAPASDPDPPIPRGVGVFNPEAEWSPERLAATSNHRPVSNLPSTVTAVSRFTHPARTSMMSPTGPQPKDYVLSVLGAEPDRPVRGTLMLTKLLFLVSREIDPRAADELKFYAFDYGPFSKVLMETVERLVADQAVSTGTAPSNLGGERVEYRLTDRGRSLSTQSLDLLGPEIVGRLQKLRKGADQLGYNGILRLVYTRYPEFATASKIREEVLAEPDRR